MAAQDFSLSPAKGADCPHEQVLNAIFTKQDFEKQRPSDTYFAFIESNVCAGDGINVGINGKNYLLDQLYPEEFGVPVDYTNRTNSVKVRIDEISSIYKDYKHKVETDPGKFCIPEYRKVKVTIDFEGAHKVVFGTATSNCP